MNEKILETINFLFAVAYCNWVFFSFRSMLIIKTYDFLHYRHIIINSHSFTFNIIINQYLYNIFIIKNPNNTLDPRVNVIVLNQLW